MARRSVGKQAGYVLLTDGRRRSSGGQSAGEHIHHISAIPVASWEGGMVAIYVLLIDGGFFVVAALRRSMWRIADWYVFQLRFKCVQRLWQCQLHR